MRFKGISTLQWYLLSTISIVILVIFTGSNFFYFILSLLLVTLAIMFYIIIQNEKKIYQDIYIEDEELSVGDTIKFEFKTNNTGMFPIAHAKISGTIFNTYKEMSFPTECIYFSPYMIVNMREHFTATKRGIFTFGEMKTEYYDPLKIFKRSISFKKDIKLIVYPRVYDLNYFLIPNTGSIGTMAFSQSEHRDYSSLKKVRKYAPGDSFKRIHWKLSSKRGEIYVKEYDSTSSSKVTIFLDAFKPNYSNDINRVLEDKVVEVAASITKYSLNLNIETSLLYHDEKVVQIENRDVSAFQNVLKELTSFVSEGSMPFTELIVQETKRLEQGSFIVLITTAISEELISALIALKRRSFDISLITVQNKFVEDERNVMLESIGVKIYPIEATDDIVAKLEVYR